MENSVLRRLFKHNAKWDFGGEVEIRLEILAGVFFGVMEFPYGFDLENLFVATLPFPRYDRFRGKSPTGKATHMKQVISLLFACMIPLEAGITLDVKGQGVQKTQVVSSMLGYRDTLLFYIFEKSGAVLVVNIGNKDLSFPVTAKLYAFGVGAGAEMMEKWVNNQHSDGLYPGVAVPESVHQIPAVSCVVEKHEFLAKVESTNGNFSTYAVTFRIKDASALGNFTLEEFNDIAEVNVAIKPG